MRRTEIKDEDLPTSNNSETNEDLIITTVDKTKKNEEDNKPARVEFQLTKKEKAALETNAKEKYGLKVSAAIRMVLKKEGLI